MKTRSHPLLIQITIFFLVLHLPAMGWGYDVDTGHAPITGVAFDAYASCFPDDNTFSRNHRRLARRGNIAMDKGVNKLPLKYWAYPRVQGLFHLSQRAINWHFFNPNKTDQAITRRKAVEQSQRQLWQRAKAGFAAMRDPDSKVIFLGALLHLTEDVSVPAHVVPVYHGPTSVTSLGQFEPLVDYLKNTGRIDGAKISDAIDALAPDTTWLRGQFQPGSKNCSEIRQARASTPDEIRNNLAMATLSALKTPIANCNNATWGIFWNGEICSEKNKYFDAYNIDIPEFNRNGHIIDQQNRRLCTLREGDGRYRAFVNARHLEAVKADLHLLRWASRRLAP